MTRAGDNSPYRRAAEERERLFLVEHYVPLLDEQRARALSRSLDEAAAKLRRRGHRVHWLETLALLADEVCLSLFAACTTGEIHEINRTAQIDFDRVLTVSRVVPPA